MLVEPFKHVTVIAGHANPMDLDSGVYAVHSLGQFNYVDVTVKVHTLFAAGTPPSPHLNLVVSGSNDGQNWSTLSDFNEDITGTGLTEVSAFVTFPLIRFHFTMSIANSSPGDWATAILCCHANLSQR